ncbi:MAG: DUF386 domain-containing protein [Chloroflexi bacterium]|nr:DUF386 domain-containing protein [Chloroflexota bacterium]
MIYDHLKNIDTYRSLGPGFDKGIDFILDNHTKALEPGRYEIDGSVYARVNVYETKEPEEAFIEAHHEYIDFQFMLEGIEDVVWAPLHKLEATESEPEKDLYKYCGNGERYPLEAGYFMILFPTDAHMPSLTRHGAKQTNKKLILKIKVNSSLLK